MRILALGLLSLCPATPLLGQDRPVHVTFVARGGALTQSVPLRQDFGEFVPGRVSSYRLDHGRAMGASLEVGRAGLPLGIRLELNRSSSLTLEREPGAENGGAPLYGPASGRVTTATIAILVEPRQTCVGRVCPRVLVGGGVKQYRFDARVLIDDIVTPFAEDQSQGTLHVGAGVRTTLSHLVVVAEISDFRNGFRFGNATYPGKRTHDTIVSLGVGIRLPRGA